MSHAEFNWLETLLVGLAGLALASPAVGQVIDIQPPPVSTYEGVNPQVDIAPSTGGPALGRGRAWLFTARHGDRMPLWRPWRRGAAGTTAVDSLPASGAGEPRLFHGQILARSRAVLGRMRGAGGRGATTNAAGDSPELDIDLGMPLEEFGPGQAAAQPPSFEPPAYGAPAYGAPQSAPPEYGAQGYGAQGYGAPNYGAPSYGAPSYSPLPSGPQGTGVVGNSARGFSPALPQPPANAQDDDVPELNIEIDAPTSSESAGGAQRSVLAPGRFRRGRDD